MHRLAGICRMLGEESGRGSPISRGTRLRFDAEDRRPLHPSPSPLQGTRVSHCKYEEIPRTPDEGGARGPPRLRRNTCAPESGETRRQQGAGARRPRGSTRRGRRPGSGLQWRRRTPLESVHSATDGVRPPSWTATGRETIRKRARFEKRTAFSCDTVMELRPWPVTFWLPVGVTGGGIWSFDFVDARRAIGIRSRGCFSHG